MTNKEKKNYRKLQERIESGEIVEQKSWQMIYELNSFSEERLNSTALINGKRSYTYRQMFRRWRDYAEVFSALGITEKNSSRVGIIAGPVLESIFAFYALNMLGVSVSMLDELFCKDIAKCGLAIEKEGITDIIITDDTYSSESLKKLVSQKRNFGLKHVIMDYPVACGPVTTPLVRYESGEDLRRIREVRGVLFMDELLKQYEAWPVVYGSGRQDDAAVIVHTSGTTKGVQKPIPLSDSGLNEAVARLLKMEAFRPMEGRTVIWLLLHPASSYSTVDMIHLPLAYGGCVVSSPRVFRNPMALRTIEHYKVNVFFMPVGFPELIMKLPFRPDLSSLEIVVLGGGFVSPENKKKYDKFLKDSGSDAKLMIGYGLAEVGAACFLAPPDNEIASFGYPMPGVKVKLYSEEDERFYNIDDGQHTGVMYISSGSLSSGKIGEDVYFSLEKIDGEDYLNTNDVVRVNEDGSLIFVGRANRFFVNNEGVRFDAGLVETAVAAQPGIVACGLVPAYSKAIHDTVPVLYLETDDIDGSGQKSARDALVNVFIRDSGINRSNLPSQCMICEELPRNTSGKVDIFRIREEGVQGKRYKVEPVYMDGKLTDVKLRKINEAEMTDVKGIFDSYGIPDELENHHSAKENNFAD